VSGEFRFSPRPNRAAEIAWRPWGEEAFAEARRLERPVLLSLSAVWCHWCHVMDETSYSDPVVIERINRDYVPVRVDNDRDPDVNRRYNMGGWPTTAFLTGTGQVLTGATYLPPDQMASALERVKAFFDENREALAAAEAEGSAGTDERRRAGERPPGPADARNAAIEAVGAGETGSIAALVDSVALQIVRAFDPVHGGIGREPKFPQADVFAFLLAFAGLRAGETSAPLLAPGRLREVLESTLTNIASGGMYDHVGHGFFRYATERDWSTPHYEKMLEDNARLASLYLEASEDEGGQGGRSASPAGDPDLYRRTAGGVFEYLLDTLWQGDPPVFSGSQDADEHYYNLGAEGRAALEKPFVDTTVYVDWNALAARALLRGAYRLDRPELAGQALALLDHLWEHARRDGALVHYLTPEGEQGASGPLLVDQTSFAAALLDAYEVTGRADLLERAAALADWVDAHLVAPDGRLHDRPADAAGGGLLTRPLPALEEDALMADVLLRLEAYGRDGHRERALALLAAWAPHHAEYGVAAAPYAAALLRRLEGPAHLVVVGPREDDATDALHAAALAASLPLRTVERLDPADDADRLTDRGIVSGPDAPEEQGRAAAAVYVCRGSSCLAPAYSPEELRARLSGAT
jgi:hypothetical protein